MNVEWWNITLPACLIASYIITRQFFRNVPVDHFAIQRHNKHPGRFFYPFFHLNIFHLTGNCFILFYCSLPLPLFQFLMVISFSYILSTFIIIVLFPLGKSVAGSSGLSWGSITFLFLSLLFGKIDIQDSMLVISLVGIIGISIGEIFKMTQSILRHGHYPAGIVHVSGAFGGVSAWCFFYSI